MYQQAGSCSNTSGLYSGAASIECRQGNRISRLWFFPSPPGKWQDNALN
jgi:hypothetical protein